MDRRRNLLGGQERRSTRIMLLTSAQRGVTLIEMLIGIAIVAMVMAVGVPSYTAWIQNTQIRTATESALNGMQLARNEAVRQNASVQLKLGTQSSWEIRVGSDAGQLIQSRDYGTGSKNVTVAVLPANATTITFNPLGRVAANADASATITQLDFNAPTSTANRNLRIVVTAGGNVRMCDPAVTDTADPRYC
jgi:type IV fimbrial biogenesis protein FimT